MRCDKWVDWTRYFFSLQTVDTHTVERVTSQRRALQEHRRAQIERIAARLMDPDRLRN